MGRLSGKSVIVIGAGTGIGAETCLRLGDEGATVTVADLDLAGAERVAEEVKSRAGQAIGVGCDISDEASVNAAVEKAVAHWGRIDGAHMNAAAMRALAMDSDALTVPMDVYDEIMAVNMRGHLLATRAVLPHLLKQKTGAIVYTSSDSAFEGEVERPTYGMSKAGITALARHVASRWGKDGIRANVIAPGLVVTKEMHLYIPDGVTEKFLAETRAPRLGRSADIAAMVAMLMSDDGEWINGQVYSVNGGRLLR